MLDLFAVPRGALPSVEPTAGGARLLRPGCLLTASAADQAVCAAAALAGEDGRALVSLGTGTFILGPECRVDERRPGHLTTVIPQGGAEPYRSLLEGTVHAGLPRAWPGRRENPFPDRDPLPGIFCLPDRAGVGAPHWRSDLGPIFSRRPDPAWRDQAVTEGLLFRIAELLTGQFAGRPAPRVVMAGGAGGVRMLAAGLAALLGRPVELAGEPEQTLAGILRLAAGRPVEGRVERMEVPAAGGAYLAGKRHQWEAWVGGHLAASRPFS